MLRRRWEALVTAVPGEVNVCRWERDKGKERLWVGVGWGGEGTVGSEGWRREGTVECRMGRGRNGWVKGRNRQVRRSGLNRRENRQ